jgi:hypothetical protein
MPSPDSSAWAASLLGARRLAARPLRTACLVIAGTFVVLALYNLSILVPRMASSPGSLGVDFHTMLDHTRRWLSGGNYYLERQLHGQYPWFGGESLYPPPMALFVAPFAILPELVWWIIPLGLVAYSLVRSRPAAWALAVIAVALWYPRTEEIVLYGNFSMWVAGAVAAGTIWGWPALLVLLKPTLAPFALVGAWQRSWWVGLLVLGVVSLALLPMWADYTKAISGASQGWNESWDYSLRDLPLVLVPVVGWLAGRRRPVGWPLGVLPRVSKLKRRP